MARPHIVIVGAGFGGQQGAYVARRLRAVLSGKVAHGRSTTAALEP
jgi:NADH dehydrogenase FAD-containing subunit